ncbi:MerR family transcriptional regulator [Cytobacillus purgationiresistens]|uniref:DNA-binding transcriptional MerR regulator n=1 Tax=Cytobacillus purgationiresistens TaxID=863449 RepID=A0ABU0AAM8_9BACI|nr:MerR family transcriptional regulator [Cytobacillus purgationiresistens]MDQ0268306.1 DNA-binding transcriptional MerR regulator [Cytobacillus purgationiresistens]
MKQIMQAYTINEVSKNLNVPPGTLRQWEKDLKGILIVPRSKNGARFYTEEEIQLLSTVKDMRSQNLSQKMIRKLLKQHLETSQNDSEGASETIETSLKPIQQEQPLHPKEDTGNMEQFMAAMETFKDHLLIEIKNEIRTGIKKEVIDEMKKEISKSSLHTVKSLSDSIYKSNEKTKAELEGMTDQLQLTTQQSTDAFETLAKRVAKQSKRTTDQIHYISNKIEESSEASSEEFKTMIHYISSSAEVTGTEFSAEISTLKDSMNADRDIYFETMKKEHEEYLHRLREREDAFNDMIVSFRNAAATTESQKTWWQFWR